jgi:predicted DNA-binding transcriptional regulator
LSGNPTNEIAHELRELLQDIYAQSGQDEDVVIYKLEVPNKERTRFESILNQLGLTTSKMRKVIGNVALL